MKNIVNAGLATLIALSSMAHALPKVEREVLLENEDVNRVVMELKDYEARQWAIGLNGETLQVDQFQKFFAQRQLPFAYFVRATGGINLGDASAYQRNMKSLYKYQSRILQQEIADVRMIKKALRSAESKAKPIGFTGEKVMPDRFISFFSERGLAFVPVVEGQGFNLGDAKSYGQNIDVLNKYENQLRDLLKAIPSMRSLDDSEDDLTINAGY